jgi:beta-mannosidase
MIPSAETQPTADSRRVSVSCDAHVEITDGWSTARCPPDEHTDPGTIDALSWQDAQVPGTAAAAMRDAGLWDVGTHRDFDQEDWWFRTSFPAEPVAPGEEVLLRLDGIATVSEVYLNGAPVLGSESMFAEHSIDVSARLKGHNELAIRCHALGPLLERSRRPRARWRTRLASSGNLRFFRTMLLGRAPGFAPGPAAVGPWRPVWLERRRRFAIEALSTRPVLDGNEGILSVSTTVRPLSDARVEGIDVECEGPSGTHRTALTAILGDTRDAFAGELRIADVATWWPHTHGDPALYAVRLHVQLAGEDVGVDAGRVGFRTLGAGSTQDHAIERDGLDLHVNGIRVFARGAVWSPIDIVGMAPPAAALRATLELVRDAGMNMLRVPGTGAYESAAFHDLCDELGILVWQDFMFANFDYPTADNSLRASIEAEIDAVLRGLAHRPSLAVLCGNSEVEQQAAMSGLEATRERSELFGHTIPEAARRARVDAAYVPSAPCGGDLPFRPDEGIAGYYGVGCYLRPLSDARLSGVRFAAECLAFANVPDEHALDRMLPPGADEITVHHPVWKAGVPHDVGAGWSFDDVRDHYLRVLFGVDPTELRTADHDRYLELSRSVSGEVMAETFGEWRRRGSVCSGALVLWLRDIALGAGWGVLDVDGRPKVAYHHLRRALSPTAVWTIDEGLGGVVAHVANDGPAPLKARLRAALYQDFENKVHEAHEILELAPNDAYEVNVERMLGHFVDLSWAYRFGPPAQDLIVVSLERETSSGTELLSQATRFPAGRPTAAETAARLGLTADARPLGDGLIELSVKSRRLAYGVRAHVPGFDADDDAYCVEPGGERRVLLRARTPEEEFTGGALSALNLRGRLAVKRPGTP